MLPAARRAIAGPAIRRGGQSSLRRNFATATEDASKSASGASSSTAPSPKKSGGIIRKALLYSTVAGLTFYGGSTIVALNSDRYHDFFVESVPLGETVIEYAQDQEWDQVRLTGIPKQALETLKSGYSAVEGAVSRTLGDSKAAVPSSSKAPVEPSKPSDSSATKKPTGPSVKLSQSTTKETQPVQVEARSPSAPNLPVVEHSSRPAGLKIPEDVSDLVSKAEKALSSDKSATSSPTPSSSQPESAKSTSSPPPSDKSVYTAPLPLGHEPPPGYSRPAPPKPAKSKTSKKKAASSVTDIPLVAPAVRELSASEPVIAQIASSIDGLATLLKESSGAATSTSGAKDILDTAKVDLVALGTRIEAVKKEEQAKLEKQLEEQAKEYSAKMVELEMDLQDKIDAQEEGFKVVLDEERQKILHMYREKLAAELETQSEIINQRLKEEVIAQGIEMQRRWIREIKVRVEQERGGRLAKLDSLATGLKKLERVTLDNSSYLDENVRIHTLWSAIRAMSSAVDGPARKPFREELRVLRNITAAKDDPLIATALDLLEKSDVPDVGVEPLGDLIAWFTTAVAPRVENVALVPDQHAGVLSHLASSTLSSLKFKRSGHVEGNDVSSVLARAEYHLVSEKDLDSAARELNQLKGAPKVLLTDWLAASRRRLEVEQALTIIRSQATLSSLLIL